ncbi:MAG TPA: hypothetical protein VFY13_09205 [Luteolibacter sp.]|nr:hypothetical protein [Luteolibacter sp.]
MRKQIANIGIQRRLAPFFVALSLYPAQAQDKQTSINLARVPEQYEIVGDLGLKLGEMATVEGVVVDGPHKGYVDGPNMVIWKINGTYTQNHIRIPLKPFMGGFDGGSAPEFKFGSMYSLRVYETGEYVGVPMAAVEEFGKPIQHGSMYFQSHLSVVSGKEIEDLKWDPKDFIGRKALLSGTAINEGDVAAIQGPDWMLVIPESGKWTQAELGKRVEAHGLIAKTDKEKVYAVTQGRKRLTELEDQIGMNVSLRGIATQGGELWTFHYRGIGLDVENLANLPGWNHNNHWASIEVAGRLELEKGDRGEKRYIIRNAAWKPLDGLLLPELREPFL